MARRAPYPPPPPNLVWMSGVTVRPPLRAFSRNSILKISGDPL